MVGLMQTMTLFALLLVGLDMRLGIWYYLGLSGAALFAVYQQILISNREPQKCLRAFLNNNYFGMSVFAGIALHFAFA
jgi:4-hydroxybenzoate polyprenyltransferase